MLAVWVCYEMGFVGSATECFHTILLLRIKFSKLRGHHTHTVDTQNKHRHTGDSRTEN